MYRLPSFYDHLLLSTYTKCVRDYGCTQEPKKFPLIKWESPMDYSFVEMLVASVPSNLLVDSVGHINKYHEDILRLY